MAGLARAADDIDAFLTAKLEAEGLTADRLALVGFSQGTMMSLHVAPRRPAPVAAIAAFSGRLLAPERLAAEAVSKPPVLLLHGDADEVVPYPSMEEAAGHLARAGVETHTYTMQGTGHGIAPDGLGQAVGFLRMQLGPQAPGRPTPAASAPLPPAPPPPRPRDGRGPGPGRNGVHAGPEWR